MKTGTYARRSRSRCYAAFEVSTEQQELILRLTPDKDVAAGEHYGPRESVTYEIRATDYAGNPIQAEVSLNLTDLSVLSLAEPNAPPLVDFFYGRRGLGVRSGRAPSRRRTT